MLNPRFVAAAALVLALPFVGAPAAQTRLMSIDEVKPGMVGTGRTVFSGTPLEDFRVQVLGVLHNVIGPHRDLILARLSGGPLANTGVIAGMSGSPVYAQARLNFTQEQIDFLEDLQIENNQCFSEAKIYSDILAGMMDARVSIVSNNLNVLMKRLAILTVIFGLLNIPASMGGMSEFTRYVVDHLQVSPGIAYTLFTVGMGVLGWACYRVLAFFQVFSVDSSPTWRGRRRKPG